MATSFAGDKRPNLPAPSDVSNEPDPFVSATPSATHYRYSNFDNGLFASSPGSSPKQAKLALEAHLAETERRLDEAGKLGNALVSQRKALAEQLQEVEKLQAEGELNPELRQKLVEIEKEYNDLARESARAFLPKQRVPSNEANPGSPFPGGRSGRRSVSPSKLESLATGSPTKLSVPNRKVRNQPSNRVHDIEFAAEISTSLISQVRNLQSLLAEREEEARDLKNDKSSLEIESESLHQRLKTLDESEHRYKEENWNLETKLQELASQQREAADREKKLQQTLSLSTTEKLAAQKDLDEARLSHAKLLEDHAASAKHHDIELGTAKRNMAMAESERSAMQRKIDDLTSQNQELARAFSTQRGKMLERESLSGHSEEDFESAADNITPEHSPPQSPVKGTPRHSMLETETLKSSLHHAHRTIQSQRSQIHREKTEKLDLRRIIQDLRDDLERSRNESGSSSSNRKSRRVDSKDSKRYSRLLGSQRSSRQEIILSEDDPDWEDHDGEFSPRASTVIGGSSPLSRKQGTGAPGFTTDHFETANEASESAFETANERATETEDFQTTNEGFSGSDADETETETTSRGFGKMKRPPSLPAGLARHASHDAAFDSTASTSADELPEVKTPTGSLAQRGRFRSSRGPPSRNSRQDSAEPGLLSSPASFAGSNRGTPQNGPQSLFAELQDFAGSDEESVGNDTPSRTARSVTPGSIRRRASPIPAVPSIPKLVMVDSGVMTDPLPTLVMSTVHSETVEPLEEPKIVPSLSLTSISAEALEPIAEAEIPPPSLSLSTIGAEHLEPVPEAPPALSLSTIGAEHLEPVPEAPPALSLSTIGAEHLEPVPEAPPALSWSSISMEHSEPVIEALPPLSLSTIGFEHLEPRAEPEIPLNLSLSSLGVEHLEPVAELPPALQLSALGLEQIEPVSETPPVLSISSIGSEHLEPTPVPQALPAALSWSSISAQHWEPTPEREIPGPILSLSALALEHSAPGEIPEPTPAPTLSLASIAHEVVEPVEPVEPEVPEVLANVARSIPEVPSLALSTISREVVEPIEPVEPEPRIEYIMPEPPQLSLSLMVSENLEPISEPPVVIPSPTLIMSSVVSENLEPVAEPEVVIPPPALAMSSVVSENLEPVAEPEVVIAPPALAMSSVVSENLEPVAEPEVVIPPPALALSSLMSENLEPITQPSIVIPPPTLVMSSLSMEHVAPPPEEIVETPSLAFSSVITEHVEPISEPESPVPEWTLSSITTEHIAPVHEPEAPAPEWTLSSIATEHIAPVLEPVPSLVMSSIGVEAIDPPTPVESSADPTAWRSLAHPHTTAAGDRGLNDFGKRGNEPLVIAEDETSQSLDPTTSSDENNYARQPLEEISTNPASRSPIKASFATSDNAAQTALTADVIDQLLQSRRGHGKQSSYGSGVGTPDTTGTVRIHRADDRSGSPLGPRNNRRYDDSLLESTPPVRRPGSATSARTSILDAPPLPPNHREVIEAARTGSMTSQVSMGPPLWPASATNKRPHTPSLHRPDSAHSGFSGTPTPRTVRASQATQSQRYSDVNSPARTTRSRRSSVSSFVSELDSRFNMRNGEMDPTGLGPNTDPRMIQAITQTMIGEYLWKYTRKTGRGEMSEKRHRRYFWVHPYTRTLYWSDRDPSAAGRHELRAKSVPIEAVRVVTDDNPMPPGLHRKSLVIISPGRTIKFTCTTGQRHETWFNALSYLLLRTNNDAQTDADEMVGNITRQDVDEFNPQVGGQADTTARRRPPPSLSSYNSRASRAHSPTAEPSMAVPTLTPSGAKGGKGASASQRASTGTMSKFSGYFRPSHLSGTFSSIRGRGPSAQNLSIYQASEVHDSAEDLREIIERQDRESDRLENVRACCDGKHDVGTLHRAHKKPSAQHIHSHPGHSTASAPTMTVRSRVQNV